MKGSGIGSAHCPFECRNKVLVQLNRTTTPMRSLTISCGPAANEPRLGRKQLTTHFRSNVLEPFPQITFQILVYKKIQVRCHIWETLDIYLQVLHPHTESEQFRVEFWNHLEPLFDQGLDATQARGDLDIIKIERITNKIGRTIKYLRVCGSRVACSASAIFSPPISLLHTYRRFSPDSTYQEGKSSIPTPFHLFGRIEPPVIFPLQTRMPYFPNNTSRNSIHRFIAPSRIREPLRQGGGRS